MTSQASNGKNGSNRDEKRITFTIDGLEVEAHDGDLLIEAAKRGDVEIPYFCYERKLGPPVGACRMCLVEIEGIPKLQTACSTPVKDGMVVNSKSGQVKQAQQSVVELLLVNHPLDCPVCDKGGECPLQDITMGWGPGRSRVTDPKRHFVKPVALSSLIAIDRERCILCYRCVRFSQEVSEDDQLTLLGRGADTFVGTHDGSMYTAPFSGNVIELCPVGALTSTAYRFKARPWDIQNSASICTLCPSQCNIHFTVRDERVVRVIARDNPAVDDGWLCDKGRFGYRTIYSDERITQPLVRNAGLLKPASWEEALEASIEALKRAGERSAAIVGGETTNEEGFLLQGLLREALGSANIDSRIDGLLDPPALHLLNRPELQAAVPDIDSAQTILVLDADPINEMSILDLRIRKAVRHGRAKLVVAASRPTALDARAVKLAPYRLGAGEALLAALTKAIIVYAEGERELKGHQGIAELKRFYTNQSLEVLSAKAGADPKELRDAARAVYESSSTVIIWGGTLAQGERAGQALRNLTNLALLLQLDQQPNGGLLKAPQGSNSRGLSEVGCLPNMGTGLCELKSQGLAAGEIGPAAAAGEIDLVYLLHSDPCQEHPDGGAWREGLKKSFVIAHAQFLSDSLSRSADVVFPAESYAEKQGTVTHPDGRLQRLRSAVPRPGKVRMEWQVLADLARKLGWNTGALTPAMAFNAVIDAVPFYDGLTLKAITARGARWQDGDGAGKAPEAELMFFAAEEPQAPVATSVETSKVGA